MSGAKKYHFSIYLIKDDFLSEIVKKPNITKRPIDGIGSLFYKSRVPIEPAWVSFLEGNAPADVFKSLTAEAVLETSINVNGGAHRFAIAFGLGRNLLDQDSFTERFGLITVLNTIEQKQLRQISKSGIGGKQTRSNEQASFPSDIAGFTFDRETDLITSVVGKSTDESLFSGMMSGGDSLSLSVSVSIHNLKDFLGKIYLRYCSTKYKESFDWVDNISLVKDLKLESDLYTEMIKEINNKTNNIWMAVPEDIDWSKTSGFRVGKKDIGDDILLENVISLFDVPLSSFDQIKNLEIEQIGGSDDKTVENTWPASKCLYGEIDYQNSSYCINCGKWYLINQDFKKLVDDDYAKTPVSEIPFLPFLSDKDKKEEDYNERFAKNSGGSLLKMDQKNIDYGNYYSKIELCDILGKNNLLIHVKRYSGSSTLSHLFNQGFVSAELIRSDPNFVAQANSKIQEQSNSDGFLIDKTINCTVVFAIISKGEEILPRIPFFSEVSLRSVKLRISNMGYKAEMNAIRSESV